MWNIPYRILYGRHVLQLVALSWKIVETSGGRNQQGIIVNFFVGVEKCLKNRESRKLTERGDSFGV